MGVQKEMGGEIPWDKWGSPCSVGWGSPGGSSKNHPGEPEMGIRDRDSSS